MLRRVALLALALVLRAAVAAAQGGGCSEELQRWAARCADARHVDVRTVVCPSDELAVLSASTGGAALRIEVSRGMQRGFRRVNGVGLSPIGEFPDWGAAPPALREAFARVEACTATPLPRRLRGSAIPAPPHRPFEPRAPWLLALAALVAAWRARGVARDALRRNATLLAGSAAATLALRALRHPPAYFHQNGQGPLWVDHLITPGHFPYGPGFAEVFAPLAARAPAAPERVVFGLQSALAATQPACAWWIARAVGADPWVAGGLAVATALDPVLGRIARSEAYFATGASLGMLAAVAIVRARDAWGPLVAGLLLAQAVRVHPALWAPMALVPFAALLVGAAPRERARATLVAFGVVGAVVALTSSAAVLSVLRSEVGAHWLGVQSGGSPTPGWPTALVVAGLVVAAAMSPARGRAAIPVALLALAFTALRMTDNYTRSGSPPWVVAAYARDFLPLALPALAALAAALAPARRTALAAATGVGLALALAVLAHRRRDALLQLPTDALELQRAWSWRGRLPRGARVLSVTRAERYLLVLPIHGGAGRDLQTIALDPALPPPDPRAFGPDTYYYRASTCSAPPARAWCDAFERLAGLRPVETFSLPAIPSMAHLTYTTPRISVGLYRVTE